MEELTMKEKIDKLIDGNEELRKFAKENDINFLSAINDVVYTNGLEKLQAYAKELDRHITTDVFARGNDREFSHINRFTYRGVEFYDLVRRDDL